jgi:solute carrier family 25 citrate transporter 1
LSHRSAPQSAPGSWRPRFGPRHATRTGAPPTTALDLVIHTLKMSSAPAKEEHPALKGPSALRSILAGSTAGAVEIGEFWFGFATESCCRLLTMPCLQPSHTRPNVRCMPSEGQLPPNRPSNTLTVAKTRTQLNRRLAAGQKLPWPPFGSQWYAGCTTLIIGNSAKAGIRMFSRSQGT